MNPVKKNFCKATQLGLRAAGIFVRPKKQKILSNTKGITDILSRKNCKHAFLVTDSTMSELEPCRQLKEYLGEKEISCRTFVKEDGNPTTGEVEAGFESYQLAECDCIIALGGGSVIDLAKAIGARSVKPYQFIRKMKGYMKIHTKLPLFIAVPTTAGSGSETTGVAMIVDAETKYKYVIEDPVLTPGYIVYDPTLTETLPPHLTVSAGMTALSSAIESYLSRNAGIHSRRNARKAVKLILQNLETAFEDGSDSNARKNLLLASYYAGTADARTRTGYIRAIANTLGGEYGISHGLAQAMLLPLVLDAYESRIHKKLWKLALETDIINRDTSYEEGAEIFIEYIRDMNNYFGIVSHLEVIHEREIGKLSRYADKEANPFYAVPVLMGARELEEFYYKLMK